MSQGRLSAHPIDQRNAETQERRLDGNLPISGQTNDFLSIKTPSGGFFFDWDDPVDRQLWLRALEIIKPAFRDHMKCAQIVSWCIQFLRWAMSSGAVEAAKRSFSAAWRNELTNSALVLRSAAIILRSFLPKKHPLDSPFGRRPIRLSGLERKLLARFHAQKTAIIFLETMASEWEDLARKRAGSTKTPDLLKQQCARLAYYTLCGMRCRPTLTAEGQFFLLAALYHESATGRPDGNLERSCRAAFLKRRPKAADDSQEFSQGMRQ